MDEPHRLAAARYIALNPVVSGLASRAEEHRLPAIAPAGDMMRQARHNYAQSGPCLRLQFAPAISQPI